MDMEIPVMKCSMLVPLTTSSSTFGGTEGGWPSAMPTGGLRPLYPREHIHTMRSMA